MRKRGGQIQSIGSRLDRLSMPVTECGCHVWLGELDDIGYGIFKINGKAQKAHRVSWMENKGVIPDGLKVLHRCDIRCCINADHLFLGTQADNVADMMAKGRNSDNRGEKNANAKITAAQADEIRFSSLAVSQLCQIYGLKKSMIYNIRRGANWNV